MVSAKVTRNLPKIPRTLPKIPEDNPNISKGFRRSPEHFRRLPNITRTSPKISKDHLSTYEDRLNTSQDFRRLVTISGDLRRSPDIFGAFFKLRKIEGPVCFSSETVTVVFLAKLYYLTSYIIKKFLWQPNWTWPAASSNFGCPRNFFHPIISKLDSM